MRPPDVNLPDCYFALPRLIARARGRNAARTETNWLEANVVGTVVVLISYLVTARLLLSGFPGWKQVALALPTLLVMWLGWLLLFYFNALIIRLLRTVGLMRDLPDARAQTLLIALITSGFAYDLLRSGSWIRVVGALWLLGVALNLPAAVILALTSRNRPDA